MKKMDIIIHHQHIAYSLNPKVMCNYYRLLYDSFHIGPSINLEYT